MPAAEIVSLQLEQVRIAEFGTRFRSGLSWLGEDAVRADPAPDHVSLARPDLLAVRECHPAIRRERELPHAVGSLNAL